MFFSHHPAKREKVVFEYKDGSIYQGGWDDARVLFFFSPFPFPFPYSLFSIFLSSFFENRQKNGFGKFTWENKATYEGEWVEDERCGQGTMIFNTGEKFVGQWFANKPSKFSSLSSPSFLSLFSFLFLFLTPPFF